MMPFVRHLSCSIPGLAAAIVQAGPPTGWPTRTLGEPAGDALDSCRDGTPLPAGLAHRSPPEPVGHARPDGADRAASAVVPGNVAHNVSRATVGHRYVPDTTVTAGYERPGGGFMPCRPRRRRPFPRAWKHRRLMRCGRPCRIVTSYKLMVRVGAGVPAMRARVASDLTPPSRMPSTATACRSCRLTTRPIRLRPSGWPKPTGVPRRPAGRAEDVSPARRACRAPA